MIWLKLIFYWHVFKWTIEKDDDKECWWMNFNQRFSSRNHLIWLKIFWQIYRIIKCFLSISNINYQVRRSNKKLKGINYKMQLWN